ncbi:MAG: hypothetical protein JST93_32140 [Acidobacteria bacterium]|nr:hypothetical protein [Acidobacteriota bacterium]
MTVLKTPVMGLFRHPVDGAHAAQVLREKGFSTIAIRPVEAPGFSKVEKRKGRMKPVAGIVGLGIAVIAAGWTAGHAVNRVIGFFAALTVLFIGIMGAILYLNWGTTRVKRYPRHGGVLLTVECRSGEEPEVAETLRHAGAVQIKP